MIFKELLELHEGIVKEAVQELFDTAKRNQTHDQDLLLVVENGMYMDDHKGSGTSPYVVGDGRHGFADRSQYEFYHSYRTLIETRPMKDILSEIKADEDKFLGYKNGVQIELLIYLKFWETTNLLRRLVQLTRLALGQAYDWHFEITKNDSRHEVIRNQIRNPIEKACPKFFALLKGIYLSQIRNAVGHSDFHFQPNGLVLLNYSKNPKDHAPLNRILFEEWAVRFHLQILLYNELIGQLYDISSHYKGESAKHLALPIRVTKEDGTQTFPNYKWDPELDRWKFE